MCGRFNLVTSPEAVETAFQVITWGFDFTPRFNICPGQDITAVVHDNDGKRGLNMFRWGLIPPWSKDIKIGYKTINARAETVETKPAFRSAFKRRRCLVVATGYYEWRRCPNGKQPYHIRVCKGEVFAFAGICETGNKGSSPIQSCSIITTKANELLSNIHPRMPVILDPDQYDNWLSIGGISHLTPYHTDVMDAYPVSTRVNSPKNNDERIIKEVDVV
jgi:putative SOS response-associated peptidase YedK